MKIIYIVYIMLLVFRHNVLATEDEDTVTEETQTKSYHIREQIKACSRHLSTFIKKLCDNVFKIVKRDTSMMIEKLAPPSLQQQKNKERLLVEESWRRVRRQITQECCNNACTVGNIMMYCPDDAKLLQEHPDIFDNF